MRTAEVQRSGPLAGIRVLEFAGIGPGPYGAMLLADLGADVAVVQREGSRIPDTRFAHFRGRSNIVALDLKSQAGVEAALALAERADVLIEGFRPGVMEKLGLGPEILAKRNPKLVYARMTGWGQFGPAASEAGHDINYISRSGALAAIGPRGGAPAIPLNLVGDLGGGSLFLVVGILSALLEARTSGRGQVVDAAICDGAVSLMGMIAGFAQGVGPRRWSEERGTNFGDGGRHYYNVYECADGKYVSVGAMEPQFYKALREVAGLEDPRFDEQEQTGESGDDLIASTAALFRTRPRDAWCELAAGSDACLTPVLTMSEASADAHNRARGLFIEMNGIEQPAPAPRFSRTPGAARSSPDRFTPSGDILTAWSDETHPLRPIAHS